jgi:hypothetical protein
MYPVERENSTCEKLHDHPANAGPCGLSLDARPKKIRNPIRIESVLLTN